MEYAKAPGLRVNGKVYKGKPGQLHAQIFMDQVPEHDREDPGARVESGMIGHDDKFYERNEFKHLAAAAVGKHPDELARPDALNVSRHAGHIVFTQEHRQRAAETMAQERRDNEARHAAFAAGMRSQQKK